MVQMVQFFLQPGHSFKGFEARADAISWQVEMHWVHLGRHSDTADVITFYTSHMGCKWTKWKRDNNYITFRYLWNRGLLPLFKSFSCQNKKEIIIIIIIIAIENCMQSVHISICNTIASHTFIRARQNNKINIFDEHYICWLNAISESFSLLVVSNEIPLTHFQLLLNSAIPKNVAWPSSPSSSSSSLPSVYYSSLAKPRLSLKILTQCMFAILGELRKLSVNKLE